MKSIEHISEEKLIEFLENGKEDNHIANHLAACQQCENRLQELSTIIHLMSDSKENKAPAHISFEVAHAIEEEKGKIHATSSGLSYWQVAAAIALLIVGYTIGSYSEGAGSSDLSALKAEVEALKEVTMVSALQNYSASQRIQAVNQIQDAPKASIKLTQALLETLNTDESPNVRYAALQAITKFEADSALKEKLVSSLKGQEDPLIQIALISYLVQIEEKTAIAPLRDLVNEKDASPEVVRQAKIALDILT
ncbi:MAG: HEAT repeat domain-containing protein [Cyclobacteriaceae bacterium]